VTSVPKRPRATATDGYSYVDGFSKGSKAQVQFEHREAVVQDADVVPAWPTPLVLRVVKRQGSGKYAARDSRERGFVPGLLFSRKHAKDKIMLDIDAKELRAARRANTHSFSNSVLSMHVFDTPEALADPDAQPSRVVEVLPKQVVDHWTLDDSPIHGTFLEYEPNTRYKLDLPVRYEGQQDCPGVIKDKCIIIYISHTLPCYWRGGNRGGDKYPPREISFDFSATGGRKVITSNDLGRLPKGITLRTKLHEPIPLASVKGKRRER
jgi:ribosomal protein L25 (general stress protein Ctc)